MKSLILATSFGKFHAYLESNNKIEVYELDKNKISDKKYSTVVFNGVNGIGLLPDEIPYSNGNRTLDDVSYSFGQPSIPMMDLGINLANSLGKEIGAVYFIAEKTNSTEYDAIIKSMFRKHAKRDIYKGTVGFVELIHSIGMVYSMKVRKSIQVLTPIFAYNNSINEKHHYLDSNLLFGIGLDSNFSSPKLLEEFNKRFSHYLDLFDEKKNLTILRGMYLAGFYGYLYENKEEDIENIYQDRRIKIPFSEIKSFMEEVHIPAYKELLNQDDVVFSIDIPRFNECFNEYNVNKEFIMSRKDFLLYAKMLLDFNNDITIKPYRLKSKDFICVFGKNIYGRKSKEFLDKQLSFVDKAVKNNE